MYKIALLQKPKTLLGTFMVLLAAHVSKGDSPNLMPAFTFNLTGFDAQRVRSRNKDTVFVSVDLKIGDKVYPSVTRKIGDIGPGHQDVGITFGPITPDSYSDLVVFSYVLVNSGHDDEVFNKLRNNI